MTDTAMALAGVAGLLVFHVWLALGLGRIFSRLGEPAWKAWVPFLNLATLCRLGEVSPGWVVVLVVPPACVMAVVMMFVAAHRVSLRLDRGVGMTVLAVVCPPLWASVLGFSRELPHLTLPIDPYGARGVPLASAPPTPAWVTEASRAFANVAPKQSPFPTTQPTTQLTAVLDEAEPVELSNRVWMLTPEHGNPIALTERAALLGRSPAASQSHGVQLVEIADIDKSVSKTHARLVLTGETWSIIDLSSTNGVYLPTSDGQELELEPGVETVLGESFRLGDVTITLRKVSA